MLILKLLIIVAFLLLFLLLAFRLVRRGISKRYEPRVENPWNLLSNGEDPTL